MNYGIADQVERSGVVTTLSLSPGQQQPQTNHIIFSRRNTTRDRPIQRHI